MWRAALTLTSEDGGLLLGTLDVALLSQLLAVGSAGDEGLHAEAVAPPTVQRRQLDHAALGDVLFLEATKSQLALAASQLLAWACVVKSLTLPVLLFFR